MGCKRLRKNRLLIASSILLLLTFGFVAKELIVKDSSTNGQNKLPVFEVTKKKIEKVSTKGYFKNLFSEKYVDIKIDGKTIMFTFEPELKGKIEKLENDDYIEFVYLNNIDEKEKKILTVDILKENIEDEENAIKKEEKENKILTDILSKVKIEQSEDKKKINFEIFNDSNKEQKIKFPTGQYFEVEIKNEENKNVYTYSKNFSFSQTKSEIILGPKEVYVFSTETKPLDKGKYTLDAWLLATNVKDLKVTEQFEIKSGDDSEVDEKNIDVQTKEGMIQLPANKTEFSGIQEWFVIEEVSFDGSNLTAINYSSTIRLSEKKDVKEARWAAAEKLKKEGTIIENDYKLPTDEFIFYLEKSNGNIHEIALKNINGTLYEFETIYTNAWTDSRYQIEAMVKTIQ
jgi:hypothetical protein